MVPGGPKVGPIVDGGAKIGDVVRGDDERERVGEVHEEGKDYETAG